MLKGDVWPAVFVPPSSRKALMMDSIAEAGEARDGTRQAHDES